jgi:ribonuclease P protein component
MEKRNAVANDYFVLYYQKNHDLENFRFAISVPKKFGKAHERNLMKRRIREIVKLNYFKKDIEFFVIAKMKSKELEFKEIKASIENLITKAKLLKERDK